MDKIRQTHCLLVDGNNNEKKLSVSQSTEVSVL